jgi:hypothetical protein
MTIPATFSDVSGSDRSKKPGTKKGKKRNCATEQIRDASRQQGGIPCYPFDIRAKAEIHFLKPPAGAEKLWISNNYD